MDLVLADRRWKGSRAIVAASGPSLTAEVAAICEGEKIIAVNDAYKLFPKAEILYSCDAAWWELNKFVLDFSGERWTSHSHSPRNVKPNHFFNMGFNIIEGRDEKQFSLDPRYICYGNNSGFQAVNLAILFGAKEIVLVGFDMRKVKDKTHFFGEHKSPLRATHSFVTWIKNFETAAKKLKDIRIINATPGSALTCFPIVTIEEALNPILEAAE